MARRNLNLPQAYGSGVVMVPFSFSIVATGGGAGASVVAGSLLPPDGYSFRVVVSPAVNPGDPNKVSVFLVDTFPELLCAQMFAGSDAADFYPLYAGDTVDATGHWGVSTNFYTYAAAVQTVAYSDCQIHGLFFVRNSATRA